MIIILNIIIIIIIKANKKDQMDQQEATKRDFNMILIDLIKAGINQLKDKLVVIILKSIKKINHHRLEWKHHNQLQYNLIIILNQPISIEINKKTIK